MKYPIDLELFNQTAHNPSFFSLQESMHRPDLRLRDYCVPVNPYFPTAEMFSHYKLELDRILKYYPTQSYDTAKILAQTLKLDEDNLVLANGSTELITWIDHLFIKENIATPVPTFGRWTDQPLETNKKLLPMERREEQNFNLSVAEIIDFVRNNSARSLVLCNPNNPTGALLEVDELKEIFFELSKLDLIVIDESFIDFSRPEIPTIVDEAIKHENVIVLKSLGKNFGLHGIRFGYSVSNPRLARTLRMALPRWNVNAMAESVIKDLAANLEIYEQSRLQVIKDRDFLYRGLKKIPGLKVFPSLGNFVFVKMPNNTKGEQVRNRLATEYGLITRECGNKIGSTSQYFRIAARPEYDASLLIKALRETLNDQATWCAQKAASSIGELDRHL